MSEAGRNLRAAVPVVFRLLGLVALSVLQRMEVFVVLVAAVLYVALWGVVEALLNKRYHIPLPPLQYGILAIVGTTWTEDSLARLVAYCVAAVAVVLWHWAERRRHPSPWSGDVAAAVLVLGWIGLLDPFAVTLTSLPRTEWMVVLLILILAFFDIGGWTFGVLWDRHPMGPSVSSRKSWEDFAGSLVAVVALSLVLTGLTLDRPWPVALLVGIAAVLCLIIGDLSESLLKRDLDVKNMGSISPGHKGMPDRVDLTLMWAPACYATMTTPFTTRRR